MIHKIYQLALWTLVLAAVACSSKKEETNAEHHGISGDTWKEMDDFHMIMAESFHPFKDSSNLEPAIKNAPELAAAADRWANAELPDKVDNDDTKTKLQQLKSEADNFVGIASADDQEEIGTALTALHDLFHELQEEWYAAAGDHEEHH